METENIADALKALACVISYSVLESPPHFGVLIRCLYRYRSIQLRLYESLPNTSKHTFKLEVRKDLHVSKGGRVPFLRV
jgi:hypothetical protein